ncbi:hypothetical protein PCE1_004189 [Barthelona sp. PCE]
MVSRLTKVLASWIVFLICWYVLNFMELVVIPQKFQIFALYLPAWVIVMLGVRAAFSIGFHMAVIYKECPEEAEELQEEIKEMKKFYKEVQMDIE